MPAQDWQGTTRTGRPRLSLESTRRKLHIRLVAPQFGTAPAVEQVFIRILEETYQAMDARPDIWALIDVKAVIVRSDGVYCLYSSLSNSMDQLHLVQGILAGKIHGMVKMSADELPGVTAINVIGDTELSSAITELKLIDVGSMGCINYVAGSSDLDDVTDFHKSTGASATVFSADLSGLPGDGLKHRLNRAVSRVPMDLDALILPTEVQSPLVGTIRA